MYWTTIRVERKSVFLRDDAHNADAWHTNQADSTYDLVQEKYRTGAGDTTCRQAAKNACLDTETPGNINVEPQEAQK